MAESRNGKSLAGSDIIYGEDDTYREIREKIQPLLIPVMENLLKLESRGKRVLDIGCGPGHWCRVATECGATSVDGFDIQGGCHKSYLTVQ